MQGCPSVSHRFKLFSKLAFAVHLVRSLDDARDTAYNLDGLYAKMIVHVGAFTQRLWVVLVQVLE
jgi:hypothetical protein